MKIKNILSSQCLFEPQEQHLAFQFRVLNYFMLIAVIFGFAIGFLGDQGIMKIGNIQPMADYVFAIFNIGLIWLLRQNKKYYVIAAWLFVIATLLLFITALVTVETDEARIVWFYITVYVAYMLLGVRSGLVFTLLSVISITLLSFVINLNISDAAISTYLIALIVFSVLARAHASHISGYEKKLKEQNELLEKNIESMDLSLVAAESAYEVKGLFLANMSHEIRTPMNGVLSMAQVLENTQLDEQQMSYLQSIKRSGDSLLLLIDDLLDLSKIESGEFSLNKRVFNAREIINNILQQAESLIAESSSRFGCVVTDDLPEFLSGDSERLIQVVVHLISNAAKFTSNGEIKLRINGCYVEAGFRFQIEVEDNGIGIPENQQENVFEVFQQLSVDRIANKGVGLGLSICHKIIEKMNGSISLISKEGEGSCFCVDVVMPLVELDIEKGSDQNARVKSRLRILVCEDDAISRLAIKTLLIGQGYVVDAVENGQQGIEMLSQKVFDVVLVDINMPILNGIETTRLIKEKALTKAAVIGMTASVNNEEKKSYLDAGMRTLVEKPIRVEALVEIIEEVCKKY